MNTWQAQYRLIIQWGGLIIPKPELRQENNQLKGCALSAWLAHACVAGQHRFAFDSDSRVLNGLAALILVQVQDKTTAEINAMDLVALLAELGLEKHVSASRNKGLRVLIERVQALAQVL